MSNDNMSDNNKAPNPAQATPKPAADEASPASQPPGGAPEAKPAPGKPSGPAAAGAQTPPPLPGSQKPAAPPTAANDQEAARPDAADSSAETEKLKAQIADLTDRLLRANAELQNLHKRLERERAETATYAITKFARDTVSVADNFERAISAVPKGAVADNPLLEGLLEGVTMTEREFLNVLQRHGVERIEPEGEPFNPHRHQAVMEKDDASVPSGTILEVFQSGYVIGDRSLRPAMVVVSKGGPKTAKPGQPEAAGQPPQDTAAPPEEQPAQPDTPPKPPGNGGEAA